MVIGDPTKQQSPSPAMVFITPLKCLALLRGTHLGQRPCAAFKGRTHERNRIENQIFLPAGLHLGVRPHMRENQKFIVVATQ